MFLLESVQFGFAFVSNEEFDVRSNEKLWRALYGRVRFGKICGINLF